MKQLAAFITFTLIAVFIALPASAQNLPARLQSAVAALEQNQPREALSLAESYLAEKPDGPFAIAGQLLAGRAELALDLVEASIKRAHATIELAETEEGSKYLPQVYYLLANAQQARGDHYEAARALVRALDYQPSDDLDDQVMSHLRDLVQGPVTYRAKSLLLAARTESTRGRLRNILPSAAEQPTIGLILPGSMSGWVGTDSILAGVEAAIALWEIAGGAEIELITRFVPIDEPARTVAAARDLVRAEGVWALIMAGPEDLIVPATTEAQAYGTPVVLPGQSRPGLEGLGPSVVLPDVGWRLEGKLAATYAVDVLGLTTFGIVAPYTPRGRETVEGFLSILEEREDVEILDQEWYRPNEGVSLSTQFRNLRTIGFKRELLDELIDKELARRDSLQTLADSLQAAGDRLVITDEDTTNILLPVHRDSIRISESRLEREWQRHMIEVRQSPEFKTGKIDSNAIAQTAYDMLYLPIETGTMDLFAPQFAFYNFRTVRFGNSAWYDIDELLDNRDYAQRVGFTAPMYLKADNQPLFDLRRRLSNTANLSVHQTHVMGHDALRLILLAMTGGAYSDGNVTEITHEGPDQIALELQDITRAELAAGRQLFADHTPVALASWFLMMENNSVVPLLDGTYTLSELEDLGMKVRQQELLEQETMPEGTLQQQTEQGQDQEPDTSGGDSE